MLHPQHPGAVGSVDGADADALASRCFCETVAASSIADSDASRTPFARPAIRLRAQPASN